MLQSFKTPPPKTEAIKGRGWRGVGGRDYANVQISVAK